MTIRINTPEFRVSYPNVFKAKRNELNGQDEFSVDMLFDKGADLKGIREAIEKVIAEKWGAKAAEIRKNPNFKMPFKKGETRADKNPEYAGKIFATAKSNNKPNVVRRENPTQEIFSQSVSSDGFYAGCYARAAILVRAFDTKGNKGVHFILGNVQKMRDGEPFGSARRPEEDFEPLDADDASNYADDNENMFGE